MTTISITECDFSTLSINHAFDFDTSSMLVMNMTKYQLWVKNELPTYDFSKISNYSNRWLMLNGLIPFGE